MKTRNVLFVIGILLASSMFLFTGCKKKTETPPDPTFVVTAIPQNDVLAFIAYCSSDDIRLTKVTLKDPLQNEWVYSAGGEVWLKDEGIIIPDTYQKQLGTWRFTFVGTVVADGRSFTVSATINVTGK